MSMLSRPGPVVVRQQHETNDAEWQSWLDQIDDRRIQNAQTGSLSWVELQSQFLLRSFLRSLLPSQTPLRLPYHHTNTFHQRVEILNLETRNSSTPRFPAPQLTGQYRQPVRENEISDFEETLEVRDLREVAHNQRVNELLDMLEPIGSKSLKSSTILMVWGEAKYCHVLPAEIPHEADDTQCWKLLQDTYYTYRGKWRRRLPFLRVKQIGIAKRLSLAGQRSINPRDITKNREFIGTYTKEGEECVARDLKRAIANYIPQDPPCEYIRETGIVQCSFYCAKDVWDGIICPETEYWQNRRALSRIESQIPLVWAFRDPTLAKGNDLLDKRVFYNHRRFLALVRAWHQPALRELEFNGLIMEEGWILPPLNEAITLIGIVISVALLGKFAFGGWEPAWGAAGCTAQVATSLFFYYHDYSQP